MLCKIYSNTGNAKKPRMTLNPLDGNPRCFEIGNNAPIPKTQRYKKENPIITLGFLRNRHFVKWFIML